MNKPKFNTPYLLTVDGYRHWFDIYDEDFKVRPVYLGELDGRQCSLIMYSDDNSEIINEFAWVDTSDLLPYTRASAESIATELQEDIDEYNEENDDEYDEDEETED